MSGQEMDKLLEQSLGGDPPGRVFRARALEDSTATFIRARRDRVRWRVAALSAAAAFIAAMSFLLGRCSVRLDESQPSALVAEASETVVVPGELVVWLQAARFFKQLGMDERVALAYDRASRLVPYDTTDTPSAGGTFVAGAEGHQDREAMRLDPPETRTPCSRPMSVERTKSMIAQSFGG